MYDAPTGRRVAAFYPNKTTLRRGLRGLGFKDIKIEDEMFCPETVTEEMLQEFPYYMFLWGGNSTWNYDVYRHIVGEGIGFCVGDRAGDYLVRDVEEAKAACKELVLKLCQENKRLPKVGAPIYWQEMVGNIYTPKTRTTEGRRKMKNKLRESAEGRYEENLTTGELVFIEPETDSVANAILDTTDLLNYMSEFDIGAELEFDGSTIVWGNDFYYIDAGRVICDGDGYTDDQSIAMFVQYLKDNFSKGNDKRVDTDDDEDILDFFRFDMLKDTVFLDSVESCVEAGCGLSDFYDLLGEVFPTWLGITNLEKAKEALAAIKNPVAEEYLRMLQVAETNARNADLLLESVKKGSKELNEAATGKYEISYQEYERYKGSGVHTKKFSAKDDFDALVKIKKHGVGVLYGLNMLVDEDTIFEAYEDEPRLLKDAAAEGGYKSIEVYKSDFTIISSVEDALDWIEDSDGDGEDYIFYIKRPDGTYLFKADGVDADDDWDDDDEISESIVGNLNTDLTRRLIKEDIDGFTFRDLLGKDFDEALKLAVQKIIKVPSAYAGVFGETVAEVLEGGSDPDLICEMEEKAAGGSTIEYVIPSIVASILDKNLSLEEFNNLCKKLGIETVKD